MPESTAVAAFKDAAFAIGQTLWPSGVQVAFGHPGSVQLDDIVSFGDVSAVQEFATYGPARSREEELELTVLFSVFRAGGAEMEKVAWDRAIALQAQFEEYVRVTDTTVGGSVRECFLTGIRVSSATDENTLASGRLVEIEAVYGAKVRVRS